VTAHAFNSAASARLGAVLFKFATSDDHQAVLSRRKGLAGTKLGVDKALTPTQQAHKLELWSLFKEAKAAGNRAF
jgi:hypothetical protein